MAKLKTQNERWKQAIEDAKQAISVLIDIQVDMQDKLDNTSEKQQESPKSLVYQKVCDLDLGGALDTVEEAGNIKID